jgi:hypothetical protein
MSLLRWTTLALVLFAFAPAARAEPGSTPAAPPAPIQVMILGVYHLENPGLDVHNAKADDPTTPRRQAELAELARRLEQFKPTRVAVEATVAAADLKLAAYRAFKPAELATHRNETTQIGFRIARDVGLAEVYGIDEQSKTVDYFPFDKVQAYAKRVGGAPAAQLAAANTQVEAMLGEFAEAQKTQSIGALLARWNEPARIRSMHEFYYRLLAFGDAKTQPGAELNAAWFLRNAKIFTKLSQVAKPGDRVIVVFGSGHAYWLRHLVETTPGFQLVEPNAYLLDKTR